MNCSCSSHGSFLTAIGLEEAAQRFSLEGLAPRGEIDYLDLRRSVSGLGRDETTMIFHEGVINEQAERFFAQSTELVS